MADAAYRQSLRLPLQAQTASAYIRAKNADRTNEGVREPTLAKARAHAIVLVAAAPFNMDVIPVRDSSFTSPQIKQQRQ